MGLECYKCGVSIESGRSFIPIEPPGTPNRKWVCEKCASIVQKQQARNALGKEALEISRIFDPNCLR